MNQPSNPIDETVRNLIEGRVTEEAGPSDAVELCDCGLPLDECYENNGSDFGDEDGPMSLLGTMKQFASGVRRHQRQGLIAELIQGNAALARANETLVAMLDESFED